MRVSFDTTSLSGVRLICPTVFEDSRGAFLEAFNSAELARSVGRDFVVAQLNVSVSHRGVIRGVHGSMSAQGQAKYVQCLSGQVLDVVVDLRLGSASFGQHEAFVLDDDHRRAVFIPEGMGHAFCVLSDSAMVAYLTSTAYDPESEFAINPFDGDLGLPWPQDNGPILSDKDRGAMSFQEFIQSIT